MLQRIIFNWRIRKQNKYHTEGVDRGGGGTGVEGAESGVQGAESGVEGAGSGVEGAGSGDRGGGEPGKIGAGNWFFFIENSKKMAVLGL